MLVKKIINDRIHERIDKWMSKWKKSTWNLWKAPEKTHLAVPTLLLKWKKDVIWAYYDLNWRKLYGYNKILYVQVDSTLYSSLFRIFNAANSTLWTFCLISWE